MGSYFWSLLGPKPTSSDGIENDASDPTATSAVPIEGANLSRYDAMALEGQ
jgi:hypothetical protein